MNTLTGRRRYRASEHGLILQVEICYFEWPQWRCAWRDADVHDVNVFELASNG